MPPWASHQAIIAFTASPISWSRPGLPEKPRSSPYAMLMEEFVTPCSVAPVACPLPHGDGSVPNVADDEDDAPLGTGARSTPVAASEASSRAAPAALMPMIRVMAEPPSAPRGFWAYPRRTQNRLSCAVGTLATRHPEISAYRIPTVTRV